MHLPSTNDGWMALAAVASAVTALLNLVMIGFLARYSIRQTSLLAKQTEASIIQTKLMMKEREKDLHRDTYLAVTTVFKIMRDVLAIRQRINDHSLLLGQVQPVRPIDWHLIASSLVLAYPTIRPLPAQMDVGMTALDDAIQKLQRSEAEEQIADEKRVADALSRLHATTVKVMEHLHRGINPKDIEAAFWNDDELVTKSKQTADR